MAGGSAGASPSALPVARPSFGCIALQCAGLGQHGGQGTLHGQTTALDDMRIDLRGPDIAVTQLLLHRANVRTPLQQMGGAVAAWPAPRRRCHPAAARAPRYPGTPARSRPDSEWPAPPDPPTADRSEKPRLRAPPIAADGACRETARSDGPSAHRPPRSGCCHAARG